jgi:methylated-DNA-protein-cysteine methyltransferase related protein
MKLSPFSADIISLIQKIPKGKVATYGQIAKLAGKPHASRTVSWILHSCSRAYKLPWHRVLNSKGKISFPPSTMNFEHQKNRLHREGVELSPRGEVDLNRFQWKRRARKTPV